MNLNALRRAYARLHDEGMRLGGEQADGVRRAAMLLDLYRHSGRNHVFPLIAAHATLWVRNYAALGQRLAWWLAWQYGLCPGRRREQLASVENFAGALLDVNRRICAATYADYHFAARFGGHRDAHLVIPPTLLETLAHIHAARAAGQELSDEAKLAAFWPHFLHEQEFHVGPGMTSAVAELHWPFVKFLAQRPIVRFAYFPRGTWLWFTSSLCQRQRVANGLRAFQAAVRAGWRRTEESLAEYGALPCDLAWRRREESQSCVTSLRRHDRGPQMDDDESSTATERPPRRLTIGVGPRGAAG